MNFKLTMIEVIFNILYIISKILILSWFYNKNIEIWNYITWKSLLVIPIKTHM